MARIRAASQSPSFSGGLDRILDIDRNPLTAAQGRIVNGDPLHTGDGTPSFTHRDSSTMDFNPLSLP